MSRMLHILVSLGFYLPGYRGGGPIRSIANLAQWLGDEIHLSILTSDRDLGDKVPYPSLVPNVWQQVGKAQVMYLSYEQMNMKSWQRHLCEIEYDLIYLNSFFASQTRNTLLLRWLGKIPQRPIVIAPRGEFSLGALGQKFFKKQLYIHTTLRTGIYNCLTWHATSTSEVSEIRTALCPFIPDIAKRILLAPNLSALVPDKYKKGTEQKKQYRAVRLVFLSRIVRMKNLDFALTVLHGLKRDIQFDIYGPKEDLSYWKECEKTIQKLSPNIQVNYCGEVKSDQVSNVLSKYDLLFLPTLGENFGHAIVEAWAVGCPVLISDQTPWRNLAEKGIGWDLPLSEPEKFRQVLRQVIEMDHAEFSVWSERSREFSAELIRRQSETDLQAYRELFMRAQQ